MSYNDKKHWNSDSKHCHLRLRAICSNSRKRSNNLISGVSSIFSNQTQTLLNYTQTYTINNTPKCNPYTFNLSYSQTITFKIIKQLIHNHKNKVLTTRSHNAVELTSNKYQNLRVAKLSCIDSRTPVAGSYVSTADDDDEKTLDVRVLALQVITKCANKNIFAFWMLSAKKDVTKESNRESIVDLHYCQFIINNSTTKNQTKKNVDDRGGGDALLLGATNGINTNFDIHITWRISVSNDVFRRRYLFSPKNDYLLIIAGGTSWITLPDITNDMNSNVKIKTRSDVEDFIMNHNWNVVNYPNMIHGHFMNDDCFIYSDCFHVIMNDYHDNNNKRSIKSYDVDTVFICNMKTGTGTKNSYSINKDSYNFETMTFNDPFLNANKTSSYICCGYGIAIFGGAKYSKFIPDYVKKQAVKELSCMWAIKLDRNYNSRKNRSSLSGSSDEKTNEDDVNGCDYKCEDVNINIMKPFGFNNSLDAPLFSNWFDSSQNRQMAKILPRYYKNIKGSMHGKHKNQQYWFIVESGSQCVIYDLPSGNVKFNIYCL